MSDSEVGPSPQPCPIAKSFGKAINKFKEFFIAIADRDCAVTDQISLFQVSDEYGRFGVWGRNSGADRKGRGSLDDNLRNDAELGSIVLDLLEDIYGDLERGTQLALKSRRLNSDKHQDPLDLYDLETISDTSSDSSSSYDGESGARMKNGEMRRISLIVFDHIRSLYKVSALLRRPKVQDKYIRSFTKVSDHRKALFYSTWDQAHVAEKMWQWALNMNRHYENRIDASNFLCARLAACNTKRREQLKYWQKFPDEMENSEKPGLQVKLPTNEELLQSSIQPTASSSFSANMELKLEGQSTPSRKTIQSFSTVAQSVLNDNESFSGRPKTIYAASATGDELGSRVPDKPNPPPGAVAFQCPYCFTTLNSASMQKRQLWKKHVFRDLRPYICTFENCLNPEKMYVTRHDWLYHEMQIHRRRWICAGDCNLSFKSKGDIELHMRKMHSETFTEQQLPVLLDICEREAEPNEFNNCPLCPAEMTLLNLQPHLASHLEELALFVLPVTVDEQSWEGGSNQMAGVVDSMRKLEDLSSLESFSSAGVDQPASKYSANDFTDFIKDGSKKETGTLGLKDWLVTTEGDSTSGLDSLKRPAPEPIVIEDSTQYPPVPSLRGYDPNNLAYQSSKSIGLSKSELMHSTESYTF